MAKCCSGIGVSGGRVRGRVRVVQAETIDDLQPGEILVAKVTDVGYTPAFAYAAAVVTELGGPMSHAAIVAREFGVPCVVNARGAASRLTTGTLVEVDGGDGRGHRARRLSLRTTSAPTALGRVSYRGGHGLRDVGQRPGLSTSGSPTSWPSSCSPPRTSYDAYRQEAGPNDHTVPPVVEELKKLARERGLWNLFLPSESGLTNLEYAPLAELSGWSMELAPEALNCAAPDTGNMETLHLFANEEQSKQWLEPLLNGEIRSAFAMTEPAVASSDARNIETTMLRDGGDYVINGRKWWISGRQRSALQDPDRDGPHQSRRGEPPAAVDDPGARSTPPGSTIVRSLPVFGWQDQHGHCEITFDNVRVPAANLLGEEGGGFAIAQARLGPGRIHHCMRAIGVAERALALMVDRVNKRIAFGKPLAEQGVVQQQVALSRNEIDQARLLCHKAAWVIDEQGNKARPATRWR